MTMTEHDGAACGSCSLNNSRREFLGEVALALGAIVATLGLPSRASAMAIQFVSAHRAAGDTAAYSLPTTDGVQVDREREVILVRWAGAVYGFRLACPHQKTALKWREDDKRFQCPKHKSKYQPDGTFISGRATRGMDRYAVHRNGQEIVVDLTKSFQQDKDAAGWTAAVVRL